MLNVLMTSAARRTLIRALDTEREENPDAVFRIWESRRGIRNNTVMVLRIGLDVREENDETTTCAGLPFVADREFLEYQGRPHTFYIVTDEKGFPSVHMFRS